LRKVFRSRSFKIAHLTFLRSKTIFLSYQSEDCKIINSDIIRVEFYNSILKTLSF